MEEINLWTLFYKCATAVIIAMIVTMGGCSAYQTAKLADAVKSGVDPILARCAIADGFSGSDQAACIVMAAKHS